MKRRTLWGEHFGMLMASASPGSAIAYHLGQAQSEAVLLHCTMPADSGVQPREPGPGGVAWADGEPGPASLWHRLRDALNRFAAWSFEREREFHLAQSSDVQQLEARLHRLYRDPFLARARALR